MKKKTLGEQIAEQILQMIRDGYEVGEQIPTEQELTRTLGVGRNTVREALRMLASRNIVVIRHGAGCFVSDKRGVADDPLGFFMMEDQRKLIEDLMQMRCMIEPPIAALAAQNATADDIARLEQFSVKMEERIRHQENYAEEDKVFHCQIAECTHNSIIIKLIPAISQGIQTFSSAINQEYTQTLRSHQQILDAVRRHHAYDAEQAMQFHLMYNRNRFRGET